MTQHIVTLVVESRIELHTSGAGLTPERLAARAIDRFDDERGYSQLPPISRVIIDGELMPRSALPEQPPVPLAHDRTRDAIAAFIGALRAERRLHPELYADRLAAFITEAQHHDLEHALRRLRKELPDR